MLHKMHKWGFHVTTDMETSIFFSNIPIYNLWKRQLFWSNTNVFLFFFKGNIIYWLKICYFRLLRVVLITYCEWLLFTSVENILNFQVLFKVVIKLMISIANDCPLPLRNCSCLWWIRISLLSVSLNFLYWVLSFVYYFNFSYWPDRHRYIKIINKSNTDVILTSVLETHFILKMLVWHALETHKAKQSDIISCSWRLH